MDRVVGIALDAIAGERRSIPVGVAFVQLESSGVRLFGVPYDVLGG
jgi:hypothetical protein